MIGGYFSFQGIDGRARWHRTPVEEVLPVECLPHDDRLEIPEGFSADVHGPNPIRSSRGSRANGRCCWGPMKSGSRRLKALKCWRAFRRSRAGTRFW